jgi:hypothetical protein
LIAVSQTPDLKDAVYGDVTAEKNQTTVGSSTYSDYFAPVARHLLKFAATTYINGIVKNHWTQNGGGINAYLKAASMMTLRYIGAYPVGPTVYSSTMKSSCSPNQFACLIPVPVTPDPPLLPPDDPPEECKTIDPMYVDPSTAQLPSPSFILSLGRPPGRKELVLCRGAVARLINSGHALPFSESTLDSLEQEDWVSV